MPWWTAWLSTHPGVSPIAVVVQSDRGFEALAVLAVRRRWWGSEVTLVGDRVSDQARLPARGEEAADALAGGIVDVLDGLRGPWRLRMEQLPEGDPALHALAGRLSTAVVEPGDPCPLTRFGPGRTPGDYMSRNARKALGTARKKVQEAYGDWRVERTSDPAAVEDLLPLLVALHRDRDHALGRRSDLDDPVLRNFHAAVVREHVRRGELEILTLRLGDRIAAYQIMLVDGPTARTWDARMDAGHSHLPVGRLLDGAMLETYLDDPSCAELDWMRGVTLVKTQLANAEVATETLRAWSGPTVRRADQLRERARRAVRDAVPERARHAIRGRRRGVVVPPVEDAPAGRG